MADLCGDLNIDRINKLPEHILLNIFTYLTVKERCSVTRVCQTWKRISNDRTLWREVDLSPYRIDLGCLYQIIRKRFTPSLMKLELSGSLDSGSSTKRMMAQIVSAPLLSELAQCCPNLKTLNVSQANLKEVSLRSFPSTLESLALRHSMVPMDWFRGCLTDMKTNNILPNLTHLDMTGSSKMCDSDLKACILAWRGMTALRLNDCYRITSLGLSPIAEHLNDLVVLELSGTKCDHGVLHHLCRNNNKLETLNLSRCRNIGPECVAFLRLMTNLKVLSLNGCALGENVTLADFSKNIKLKHLDIRLTGISSAQPISPLLPHCDVLL